MSFLVDNQLPVALARWIAQRGERADHVLDLGLQKSSDLQLWSVCCTQNRIMVSKDVDFFLLANRSGNAGRLLWVRTGNVRTSDLLSRFNVAWLIIQNAFDSGQHIVELR